MTIINYTITTNSPGIIAGDYRRGNAAVGVEIGKSRVPSFGEQTPPILQGTASLQFTLLEQNLKATVATPSPYFTRGSISNSFYILTSGTGGGYAFGLYCMAYNGDLTSVTGTTCGYLYTLQFTNIANQYSIAFGKGISGIKVPIVELVSAASPWRERSEFTARFQWRVSGTHMQLTAEYNGVSALSYVDTSTPYITNANGQGVFAVTGTLPYLQVISDRTAFIQYP